MDAFLVILLLYVFLFIRKIVRLVIRLVKRPGAEEKVVETRVISRRTAENAQSKAEAAKALLAACRKSTNPIKLIGWLFGGRFGKMAGMFKWLFRQPLKLVGVLSGLIRRKRKTRPLQRLKPHNQSSPPLRQHMNQMPNHYR